MDFLDSMEVEIPWFKIIVGIVLIIGVVWGVTWKTIQQ